ncbi:MAG: type VI secretion system tube protein Hcp [Gemmatimonadota bacterium]|jgi:type VI secretion system secreted protein Hcp
MAYDAFIDLAGVEGESTRKGFEGKIELQSFSMGATNPTTIGAGGGGGAGKVSLSAFSFQKWSDKASPTMFQACCTGKHFPKAKVTLHKAGGDEAVDYLVYEFEKCYIESISWSGSSGGDDRPMESVSMAFGKVTITYTPQTETGAKGSPVVASWDQMLVST